MRYYMFFPSLFFLSQPKVRKSFGRLVFIINSKEGVLQGIDEASLNEIEDLKSFVDIEFFVKVGAPIKKTIDCFTFGGVLKLINSDLAQLKEDYDRIRELESSTLFIVG